MNDISNAITSKLADNTPGRNIILTHYVNPHLFWFKLSCVQDEVSNMERELSSFLDRSANATNEIYKVNYYVAVRVATQEHYIRGVIKALQRSTETYNAPEEYIVWALDHGYPLSTTHEQLRWLPLEFFAQRRHILRGGVANIWPQAEQLCTFNGQKRYQCVDEWCPTARQQIAVLLQTAAHQICVKLCFVENIDNVEHYWCDVQVTFPDGRHTTVAQHLANANLCRVYALNLFRLKRNRLTTCKENAWHSLQHVEEHQETNKEKRRNTESLLKPPLSLPGSANYPNRVGFVDVGQENDARKQFIEAYGGEYLSKDKDLLSKVGKSVTEVGRQVFAMKGSKNLKIVTTNRTQSDVNMRSDITSLQCKDETLQLPPTATTKLQKELIPFVHKNFKKDTQDKSIQGEINTRTMLMNNWRRNIY